MHDVLSFRSNHIHGSDLIFFVKFYDADSLGLVQLLDINLISLSGKIFLIFRFLIQKYNKMMDTSTGESCYELEMEVEVDTSSSTKVGHVQYR